MGWRWSFQWCECCTWYGYLNYLTTLFTHMPYLFIFLSLTCQNTCLKNRTLFSYTSMHTTTWLPVLTTQTFSSIMIAFSKNLILFLTFAGGRNISNQSIILNSIMHNKKGCIIFNSNVQKRHLFWVQKREVVIVSWQMQQSRNHAETENKKTEENVWGGDVFY